MKLTSKEIQPRIFKDLVMWILVSLTSFVIMIIPSLMFFLFKYLVAPEGFWQKFAIYGLGFWFLGGTQVILFILFVFWMCYFWSEW